jgi:hypothetical protein
MALYFITMAKIVVMPLTQGALGHDCHENKVSYISNAELSRYSRSKLPIGI